jgi:hypothetical protein
VLSAIHLNDELLPETSKVDDIRTDGHLALELVPVETMRA